MTDSESAAKASSTAGVERDLGWLETHPFVRSTVLDKVYGCIIGSALGDTIGLYTEFLPKDACGQLYKERNFRLVEPITEWYSDNHRNRFERCAWTDDTDQALLILLSYLDNLPEEKSISNLATDFAARLRIWISQGLRALDRHPCGIGALVGSVVSSEGYLEDPTGIATKRWLKSARNAAPNGSLMRTHPIGVIGMGLTEEACWKLAADVGRTTHVDPRCVVACCISVGLIRGMLRGEILNEEDVDIAMERAYDWVLAQPELINPGLDSELTEIEIKRHLERQEFERHVYAKSMEELQLDSSRTMGYIYKCLGSAVLTLRLGIRACNAQPIAPNTLFEDLMTDLIMEGGDSDTNGAVAGALLGTWLGYSNLPSHWSNGLAHKEWLIEKISRLTKAVGVMPRVDGETLPKLPDEAPDGGKGLRSDAELDKMHSDVLHQILLRNKETKEKAEREKKRTAGKRLSGWFK